jgi:hypothetical protein
MNELRINWNIKTVEINKKNILTYLSWEIINILSSNIPEEINWKIQTINIWNIDSPRLEILFDQIRKEFLKALKETREWKDYYFNTPKLFQNFSTTTTQLKSTIIKWLKHKKWLIEEWILYWLNISQTIKAAEIITEFENDWNILIPWDYLWIEISQKISIQFRERENDKSKNIFKLRLFEAIKKNIPLEFISTVCPAYSHDTNWLYNFNSITDNEWILSKIHLYIFSNKIAKILKKYWIEYDFTIIVADLAEWCDEMVLSRYFCNDITLFNKTIKETIRKIKAVSDFLWLNIKVKSMWEFYGIDYIKYQNQRKELHKQILIHSENNIEFWEFFRSYREKRKELSEKFCHGLWISFNKETNNYRACNWIWQYIDHFTRLRQLCPNAIIINHDTWSLSIINDNKLFIW